MTTPVPAIANTTLRLIVVSLGKLTIAWRIETIYKVVNRAQIHSSGLGYTGLTHIDDHAVVVIDLYQKLFNAALADEPKYFVILKPQVSDLIAIPVRTLPNLIDVHREQIKCLPAPYRQSDTLGIASHVAVLPQGDETLTIFIVDQNALL